MDQIKKADIAILRHKFNIKTHQVKRVAMSYFQNSQGAGRPEIFVKTNNIMKNWLDQFILNIGRNPSLDEMVAHGKLLKDADMPELHDETEWKCSKGYCKRLLARHGLKEDFSDEECF